MKRLYSVLVENRSGVLMKVAGLFSRRMFNIDSLAVGETDDPNVSCITIVSSGEKGTLEQIEKQLNKKIDVIKIKTFSEEESVSRELILVKVKYNKSNRRELLEICDTLGATIEDVSKSFMTIQMCDIPEKTELLSEMLSSISVVEVARTGILALPKMMIISYYTIEFGKIQDARGVDFSLRHGKIITYYYYQRRWFPCRKFLISSRSAGRIISPRWTATRPVSAPSEPSISLTASSTSRPARSRTAQSR